MLINSQLSDPGTRFDSTQLSSRAPQPLSNAPTSETNATDQLLTQLAKKVPGLSGAEGFKSLDASDFSPQKVADRITGFVAQGLEQARRDGKSEQQIEALYNQALGGIQQGFDEARKILDEMNLLSDSIAATIDETFDLTLAGLKGIAPGAAPSPSDPAGRIGVIAAERYEYAESFSLKVRTQDGDKVTIRFNGDESYQSSFGGYSGPEGDAVSFSIDRSASSSYRFSVEGNLDEDELDALQNLIKDMSEIANEFFDGDIQSAFDQASQFQLDKTELASMHLKLTRSESYSAVTAYQQVQDLENPNPGRGLKLGHLINDFAAKVANPGLGLFQSPLALGEDLLSNLIAQDSRYKESDDAKQSLFDQNLETLRSILDTLVEEPESDAQA